MSGLPQDIEEAIEALRDAEHRHGSAWFSDGGKQSQLERLADKAAARVEAVILAYLKPSDLGRSALSETMGEGKQP